MEMRWLKESLRVRLCLLLGAFTCSAYAAEPTQFPDAQASDPAVLGWMVGSPPPAERILRFDDGSYFRFPQMRWSVAHFRQLMPTINVSRGLSAPSVLPQKLSNDIDAVLFLPLGGNTPMSWEQSLQANYTDGIIVLHRGTVVYERYFGVLKPAGQHAAMSVTKTFMGLRPGACGIGFRHRHSSPTDGHDHRYSLQRGLRRPQCRGLGTCRRWQSTAQACGLQGTANLLPISGHRSAARSPWRSLSLPHRQY
jgi:hypothetical protein